AVNAAIKAHNDSSLRSLRCQFGYCLGGSTISNTATVTADRTTLAATAKRAVLSRLPASNTGSCWSLVMAHLDWRYRQINLARRAWARLPRDHRPELSPGSETAADANECAMPEGR